MLVDGGMSWQNTVNIRALQLTVFGVHVHSLTYAGLQAGSKVEIIS